MLNIESSYDSNSLGYTQEKWSPMYTQRLYMNIHGGVIHNSQAVETTPVSINGWTDKHSVVI